MTVICQVSEGEPFDVHIQMVDLEPGTPMLVDEEEGDDELTDGKHKMVFGVDIHCRLFFTNDPEEADCVNDAIVFMTERNSAWKPLRAKITEENFKIIPGAVRCKLAASMSEAQWLPETPLDVKMKFVQQRSQAFFDWVPQRHRLNELSIGPRFLRTIHPTNVTSQVYRHSIVLNRLPPGSVLPISKMCRVVENDVVRYRIKLVGTSGAPTVRVTDTTFGSDGWINFQIGEDGNADVKKICEFIVFNALPPPIFFKVGQEPYVFNAWKIPTNSSEGFFSSLTRSKPQRRCFELMGGHLRYYTDEFEREAGAPCLKDRVISTKIMKTEQKKLHDQSHGPLAITHHSIKFFADLESGSEEVAKDKYSILNLTWDPQLDPTCKGNPAKACMILVMETDRLPMAINAFGASGAWTALKDTLALGIV